MAPLTTQCKWKGNDKTFYDSFVYATIGLLTLWVPSDHTSDADNLWLVCNPSQTLSQ